MPPAYYNVEQLEILTSAAAILGLSLLELIQRCTARDSHTLTPDSSSSGLEEGPSPTESFETAHIASSPPLAYAADHGRALNHTVPGLPDVASNGVDHWTFDQASNHYAPFLQDNFMPMVTLSDSMQVSLDPLSAAISPTSFGSIGQYGHWDQSSFPVLTTEEHMNTFHTVADDPFSPTGTRPSFSSTNSAESITKKRRSPFEDLADNPKRPCTAAGNDVDQCGSAVPLALRSNRKLLQSAAPGKQACVRCKMQRIECAIDIDDPTGPCQRCKRLATGKRCQVQLPCLRYKIPDAVLYRPGSSLRLYADFPFEGPNAGKLLHTEPISQSDCYIEICQGGRGSMTLRMRRFFISSEQLAQIDPEKRPLYDHRYELADSHEVAQATMRHTREQLGSYVRDGMRENDPISSEVFATALGIARIKEKSLIRNTLELWAACRLSEGDWRICGTETLGLSLNSNGVYPLTPLMNAQLHASDITTVIGPFTENVLKRLEQHILKKGDIFESFLCIYILMHNYELMVARQRKVAVRRRCKHRFTNMKFIRNIQIGAKTMLAYFHYICAGYRPFSLDWDALPSTEKPFGHLAPEQKALMKKLKSFATTQGDHIEFITHSHLYEEPFYFIGQLFDHAWKPRDTYQNDFDISETSATGEFVLA